MPFNSWHVVTISAEEPQFHSSNYICRFAVYKMDSPLQPFYDPVVFPWILTRLDRCTDDLGQLGRTGLQAAHVCYLGTSRCFGAFPFISQGNWIKHRSVRSATTSPLVMWNAACKHNSVLFRHHESDALSTQILQCWQLTSNLRVRHLAAKITIQSFECDQLHMRYIQKYDGKGYFPPCCNKLTT